MSHDSHRHLRGADPSRDKAARERWYRDMGWWADERLEERYETLARERVDVLAVVDNRGNALTHGELLGAAEELARDIAAHGVGEGDRILILLPNWAQWQVALLAALKLRAIPASIPITMEAHNIAHAVDLVRCRLIVTTHEHDKLDVDAVYEQVGAGTETRPGLLVVGKAGSREWRAPLCEKRPPLEATADACHVAFTSSTTGSPKGVVHSANTLGALHRTFSDRFSLGPGKAIFMPSPLGHSVGAYHGTRLALYTGATLILQDGWNPEEAMALIERFDGRFTAAATPYLKDLISLDSWFGRTALESFLCGGAPVPPVLMEQAWAAFPNTFITNLWGMTEGGLVTSLPGSPWGKIVSTAGIGLPGLELQVIDGDGTRLPANREGELVMRGPGVFLGYAGQPDLYRSSLTEDGFFRTGDLARIDEEGYVQITGRLKELIVRGGVNISPIPIEDVLSRHPNVVSVAVVGFPDDRLGERICAVVQAGDARPEQEALIAFCMQEGLSKRQCPEVIRFIDEMPRTAAGKIRKADLRAMLTGRDQQANAP